ncbi:hypothetical protein HDU92_007195, partial [Lobulomyces angularis]
MEFDEDPKENMEKLTKENENNNRIGRESEKKTINEKENEIEIVDFSAPKQQQFGMFNSVWSFGNSLKQKIEKLPTQIKEQVDSLPNNIQDSILNIQNITTDFEKENREFIEKKKLQEGNLVLESQDEDFLQSGGSEEAIIKKKKKEEEKSKRESFLGGWGSNLIGGFNDVLKVLDVKVDQVEVKKEPVNDTLWK